MLRRESQAQATAKDDSRNEMLGEADRVSCSRDISRRMPDQVPRLTACYSTAKPEISVRLY